MNVNDFFEAMQEGKSEEAELVMQLMNYYNEVGLNKSTGYCQRQRIGVEKDLKALGYKVQLTAEGADLWEAVKIEREQ